MFNNNIGKFPSFNKNNNNNSSYINSTVSILSNFYSNPLLIPDHIHPVIHCYHNYYNITCDKCTKEKQCGFCCTYCNYDICDECFEDYEFYKIVFYDADKIKNKYLPPKDEDFSSLGWKNFLCHEHHMPEIKKGNELFVWKWQCSICGNKYATEKIKDPGWIMQDIFYYCSICNYSLCQNCANNNLKE